MLGEMVRVASRARVDVHTLEIANATDWISPEFRTSGRLEGLSTFMENPANLRVASGMIHLATATGGIPSKLGSG